MLQDFLLEMSSGASFSKLAVILALYEPIRVKIISLYVRSPPWRLHIPLIYLLKELRRIGFKFLQKADIEPRAC